jgi:anthranilate synthase component I
MNLFNINLPAQPKRKIISTDVDYYNLFCLLNKKFDTTYMFESLALPIQQDRYVSLGFDPEFIVSARGKKLKFYGKNLNKYLIKSNDQKSITIEVDNPYYELRKVMPAKLYSKTREGGLIGHLNYECINYFEPSINLEESQDFEQFKLGFYTDGLIYDQTLHELTYYYYTEDRSEIITALLDQAKTYKFDEKINKIEFVENGYSPELHQSQIEYVLEQIKSGNTFQAEVGYKLKYSIQGNKFAIYNKLRQTNPSPYMFYLKFADQELFGASPEILISNNNGIVLTTPAAGTIHRGKDDQEDARLKKELLSDKKEIAEHNMLIDLHRNDLGKIAIAGTVKIQNPMYIISFSRVSHIASDIIAILDSKKYDSFDVLAAILPGGVLTGTPKLETIKIIAHNESEPRGPYGGAVGRFSFNGDCAFALPIRSLFCHGDECFTQTCSGIVLDSDPQKEIKEVENKLAAMKESILSLAKD